MSRPARSASGVEPLADQETGGARLGFEAMRSSGRPATVHDVAAAAGVSLATVDRVLNGRAGVTDATVAKVREAVERIGYRRDDTAARLATGRWTRLLFVIPEEGTNGFMAALRAGIVRAGERLASERVSVSIQAYPALDDDRSLAAILNRLDAGSFDGVALVAIDTGRVRRAIGRLETVGIPLVTIVSDAPGSSRTAYAGIDNIAAGRVAATLLGRFTRPGPAKIGLLIGAQALRDHSERAFGMRSELEARFPHATLLAAREGRDDRERTRRVAVELLEAHPDLAAIYNAGAGNRGLIAALDETGRAGTVAVVVHELSPHAAAGLRSGHIAAVLHQDPQEEIATAIALLRAPSREHRTAWRPSRLEIVLEHNLPPASDL